MSQFLISCRYARKAAIKRPANAEPNLAFLLQNTAAQPFASKNELLGLQDEHLIFESQELTLENQELALECEELTLERQELALQREDLTLECEDLTLEDEELTLEDLAGSSSEWSLFSSVRS